MGVATAIGIGAAVSAGGAYMASEGARNASGAANRQSQIWLDQVQKSREQALQAYSEYSPAQQASLDKAMAAQTQDLARQQQLVNNINPALLDAGKQMQQLLQGQAAPVLQNLQNQRQLQRQNMLDTLRQQMGPGAETSSLGQHEMMKFDSETSNILNGAQQSYLNEVSGLALGGNATLSQSIGSATNNLGKLADSYGQIGLNKANIITGTQAQMAAPNQALINTAGSAGQAQAMQGQMLGNLGSSLMQGAAMYGAFSNANNPTNAGGGDITKQTVAGIPSPQDVSFTPINNTSLGNSVLGPSVASTGIGTSGYKTPGMTRSIGGWMPQ